MYDKEKEWWHNAGVKLGIRVKKVSASTKKGLKKSYALCEKGLIDWPYKPSENNKEQTKTQRLLKLSTNVVIKTIANVGIALWSPETAGPLLPWYFKQLKLRRKHEEREGTKTFWQKSFDKAAGIIPNRWNNKLTNLLIKYTDADDKKEMIGMENSAIEGKSEVRNVLSSMKEDVFANKKEFIVIDGKDVTPKDIGEALELDKLVYNEDQHLTLEQCVGYHKQNSDIYTMIKDKGADRVIAYVNISPLTDEWYEKMKTGQQLDKGIPPEAIAPYKKGQLHNIYFCSIVVHPDYQGSEVFRLLLGGITRKFNKLANEGVLIKRVLSDDVSDAGRRMSHMYGMEKQKGTNHDSCIYEAEIKPPYKITQVRMADLLMRK